MAQQPGAPEMNEKDKELEEMRKLLEAQGAKLKQLEEKLAKQSDDPQGNTDKGNTDQGADESKVPPKTDVTLSLRGVPEYDSYPFAINAEKFYFMASVKAPYFRSEQRAPIDLVAVVDESGSMGGERIALVKETVKFIIKNLESRDRFGIIGYSNGSREVLALTQMDQKGRDSATAAADTLRATGGTALCAGLVAGVNMMRKRTTVNEVASVMILTDGQANQGPRTAPEIMKSIKAGREVNTSIPLQRKSRKFPGRGRRVVSPALVPNTAVDEKQPEGVVGSEVDDLPCTINSFGFGTGHNESLLEAIAENGRGMYAFIKSVDMIADTFAECLGGLVSVIGQDLKVTVQALNDVEINRCMSTGYTLTVKEPRKVHEIAIKDMQSEENRELMFELVLPKAAKAKENDPIVQLAVKYTNVVKGKQETLSSVCCVNRVLGSQIGERNMELDVQYNRVLAANAMEEADDLAQKGNLEKARRVLNDASVYIQSSKSNANTFSKNLVRDMDVVSDALNSKQTYASRGGKMLKMNKKAHKWQRSVQSSAYASQSVYQNRSKSAMKKKFKK